MKQTGSFPLVTVVTPSYNQGVFIEETILSVLNQDYPYIEYIIIDGGSTDNTLEIIKRYENRLSWVSEPDQGQSHAINKGFRMANGEILSWLNSDDTYEPGAVSKAVESFAQHPDTSMIFGLINVISDSGQFIGRTTITKPFDLWSVVYWAQCIDQASTFFMKKAIQDVGYLKEDLHWCMDWDLWVRLGMKYRIVNIDHTFANIRMYGAAKTSSGGLKRLSEIVTVMGSYSHGSFAFGITRVGLGALHMILKYRWPSLYPLVKRMIFYIKNRSLNQFYENFRGVYSDGWLGRKARFMFPVCADASAIRFSLSFPSEICQQAGTLTVLINGKKFDRLQLQSMQDYELLLPYDAEMRKPTEVELVFSRFLPLDVQHRRRACMLNEISFVDAC